MRLPSIAMAFGLLSLGGLFGWSAGCSDLSDDCELNLNCLEIKEPPACTGQFYSPTCDSCLQTKCCEQVAACLDDNICANACMFSILPLPPECTANATSDTFSGIYECMLSNCGAECTGPDFCNPVTHNGCANDGSACEFVFPGNFVCIPPFGQPAKICETCNFTSGPYCGSGLRCDPTTWTCGRYCCSDGDCGTGYCELDQGIAFGHYALNPDNKVGLCMMQGTGQDGPACDASGLQAPPSGGTCFGGYPP